MKRPFADKRPFGPFVNPGKFNLLSEGGRLEPTTKLRDPRSFTDEELHHASKMFSLFHEQMAKTVFKYNWEYENGNAPDYLPEPHYTEKSIFDNENLGKLIPGVNPREVHERVPTLNLSVSRVYLYGSAADKRPHIREPSDVNRKAEEISSDVRSLYYPPDYQVSFDTEDITFTDWDDKSIQQQKRIGEDYLRQVYKAIDESGERDRLKRFSKLWIYNLMYSDIDYMMSYRGVPKPGKSKFFDAISSYNDNGIVITKFSVLSEDIVGTTPHPQDSFLVGDETEIPGGLPLTLKSEMENVEDVGTITKSDREQFVGMWRSFVDMWKGDSKWLDIRLIQFSVHTQPPLLSKKEIMGDIPVVGGIKPDLLDGS